MRRAHDAGLKVHVWTFRAENEFLPNEFKRGDSPEVRGDLAGEIRMFLDRGIDGFFADFPGIGVKTRDAYISAVQPEHQPLVATSLPGNNEQGR